MAVQPGYLTRSRLFLILAGVGCVIIEPFAIPVLAIILDDLLTLGGGHKGDKLGRQRRPGGGPGGLAQGMVSVD